MRAAFDIRLTEDIASPERRDIRFAAVLFLVAIVIMMPLAVIDIPLLADYPNHLARMHIIGNVDQDVMLGERYTIDVDVIPNIVMDLVGPWLAQALPLDVAGRLLLAFCLATTLASVAWLHHTLFNQWSYSSLLAAFFVYHGSMIAGMVNFSIGIGLVPAAFAVWIKLEHAAAPRRLLIGSLMAVGLFFCHLVAFGAYGLLLLGHCLARTLEERNWQRGLRTFAVVGMTGLLPLALLLRLLLDGEGGSDGTGIVYGNAAWKLKAALSPVANYHLPLDLVTFTLLAGLGLTAWFFGRLAVDKRMVPGLALLALAFALAPKALWNGGVFDQRLATLLALMLVASTRIELQEKALARALTACLAVLFLLRIAALTSTWLDHRQDLAEIDRAIDLTAHGGRILVVRPDVETGPLLAPSRHRVFHHAVQLASLPALAVIDKSAFVSTLYALPGQQPLTLKPPFDRLGGHGHVDIPTIDELAHAYTRDDDTSPPRALLQSWTADFDYVLMIYGYGDGAESLMKGLPLQPLLDGDILDFFKIVND